MTAISDIKALLKALNFVLEEGSEYIWVKSYINHNNYKIKVDIEKAAVDYGKQITIGGKTSSNFKSAENFVVLECVNRLLEKGYKPKSIHLEKTWATGHGTSGRLDIFVTRANGSAYLMIECKNFGTEFEKEFKKILKDGGQLFTYFQQDKNADVLLLYASHLNKGKIEYRNEIVKIEEDYRQTGNVKDFHDRWNKLPKNNGVLESRVKAYDFQSKALTPENLKDIKQEDSGFIFNQFLEILRHNVVSDKPNAFNKIFTLFLCKIYDEKVTKTNVELAFQWFYAPYTYEGISYPPDDDISFQKRLTDLYKKGMKEFLDKSVTDISDADFEKKYGKLDPDTKKQILEEFTEIRLKKNNEFAIKEVFDDDSFVENAKVVKEVVELLQGFKIRYTKKQQYLSDFFELLLTTGLKQESGQFFTPVPIAQFIIKSIPLDKIVAQKLEKGERDNLLPLIIDYAAGSGHFITESMHELQRIIDKTDPEEYIDSTAKKISTWKTDHFDWAYQYVYGIEKDYRLVKVAKVGCYLHGDGFAQIVHSDGLGNFQKTEEYKGLLRKADKAFPRENKQFDIVVSNPPYSVAAFKNNARKYYTEKDFEIYDRLTDQSSEIECLFIERTTQLLKDGGIAGIILPSSILSNGSIYTKAREIILKYFEIIAITELGSNTFMATGTNTVTLFLRRRNNYDANNIQALVGKAVDDKKDISINGIEKPISKYVAHVWENLTVKDYFTLLSKKPNQAVEESELYKDYKKKIRSKSESDLWATIIALEKEKLFYFTLAYPQKVVLVKSGDKNEEKEFLGYEFSNRRGSEGIHPIQKGKNIDECTKLFDPEVFNNPEKASTYIYQAFQGNFSSKIHSSLEKNITRLELIDMLTFDRVEFEKNLSLSGKKRINYTQIWGTDKVTYLKDVSEIRKGTSITKDNTISGNIPVIAGGQELAYYHNKSNRDGNIITVSASGAYAGFVNYFDQPIFASDCNTIQSLDEAIIPTKLIYNYLSFIQSEIYKLQKGQAQPHVYAEDLADIRIPLLSGKLQANIVEEIGLLERKENKAKQALEAAEKEIAEKASQNTKGISKKLGEVCDMKAGKFVLPYDISSKPENGLYPCFGGNGLRGYTKTFTHDGKFSLIGRQGALCGNVCIAEGKFHATEHAVVATTLPCIDSDWLYYKLKHMNLNQYATGTAQPGLSVQNLNNVQINVPDLPEQQKIVAEIQAIENNIETLKQDLESTLQLKKDILKKYL